MFLHGYVYNFNSLPFIFIRVQCVKGFGMIELHHIFFGKKHNLGICCYEGKNTELCFRFKEIKILNLPGLPINEQIRISI